MRRNLEYQAFLEMLTQEKLLFFIRLKLKKTDVPGESS